MLELRILGPVELRRDGEAAPLKALKVQTLLTALLVNANETVSVDRLLEVLWDGAPPASALANLRTYVAALRHALGTEAAQRLVTQPHGVSMTVLPGELDAAVFDDHMHRAHNALHAGHLDDAATFLRKGLAVWRGSEAASGVPRNHVLATWLLPWDEALVSAREDLAEVTLRLTPRHDAMDVLPGLQRAVGDHPLRERGWALLIKALCRVGDVPAALDAYARVRSILASELGVQPGPELEALHRAALVRDPSVCGDQPRGSVLRPPPAHRAPARPPPRELPWAPALVGRDGDVRRLVSALRTDSARPVVVTVHGAPGMGKSVTAVAAAHAAADRYPDGQIYLNLGQRAVGPTSVASALRHVLGALGVRTSESRSTDALSALLRSSVADRRVLLVLDDVTEISQVLPLLPAGSDCGVLVTSRRRFATLDSSYEVALGRLSREHSYQLLGRYAAAERLSHEAAAVHELLGLCGDVPLAVRIAAARLSAYSRLTVNELVHRMTHVTRPLDELVADDLSVRERLEEQVNVLSGQAKSALTLLGAGVDPTSNVASSELEELAEAQLLERHNNGWRLGPLVRMLAEELAADTPRTLDLTTGRRATAHS